MDAPRPLRLTPEWDGRLTGMLVLSVLGHVAALLAIVLASARGGQEPPPLVAYTVELTDPNALGGRLPPGAPGPNLTGGPSHPPGQTAESPAKPPEPAPKAEAKAEAAKPEAPKPEPPKAEPPKPEPPKEIARAEEETVHIAEKAPEPKKPEPPKPEPPKPAPPKPEPPKPPERPKPAPPPEPPKAPAAKPAPNPAPESRAESQHPQPKAADGRTEGASGPPAGKQEGPPRDAYAAAAERWRSRAGGGLGGTEEGSGPIGAGGEGKGGGGQVVGLEFLAYRQEVINTIKAQWTNVIARPGLVTAVRFEIAPDGQVSNIRLARSSGNPAYDASAMRAVQRTSHLPPPPARYASEFREFVIEFHSEESGGQGAG